MSNSKEVVVTANSCQCGDKSDVGATIKFHCKTCAHVIEKFSIKKPLKVAAITAILAYGGSQFIDYAITDNRYPMDVEHEILTACSSSYKRPLAYRVYGSKARICLCALEDTMNEISYIRYKVDEKGFLSAFKQNAKACK